MEMNNWLNRKYINFASSKKSILGSGIQFIPSELNTFCSQ